MKYTAENKQKGNVGELIVATQIVTHGLQVFFPFGDNSKSDLIVEDHNHKLHKVQVKVCGRELEHVNHVYFIKNSGKNSFRYDSNMFDWFAIVDLQTQQIAWLPSRLLDDGKNNMFLRHTLPKQNRPKHSYHMFEDYIKIPF